MAEHEKKVFASVRAVPNGSWTDKNNQEWRRLTLVIDPIAIGGGSPDFALAHWPEQIIDRLPSLSLRAWPSETGAQKITPSSVYVQIPSANGLRRMPLDKLKSKLNRDKTWRNEAQRIWKDAFEGKIDHLHDQLISQQKIKPKPEKDRGSVEGDEKHGEQRRPSIGLNSLIENDDPSALAQAAAALQSAAALLSLNFGSKSGKVNPEKISWQRFGHGRVVDEPGLISSWMSHARPATPFDAIAARTQQEESDNDEDRQEGNDGDDMEKKLTNHFLVRHRPYGRGDETDLDTWNPEIDGVLTQAVAEAAMNIPASLRESQESFANTVRDKTHKLINSIGTAIQTNGTFDSNGPLIPLSPAEDDPDFLAEKIRSEAKDAFSDIIKQKSNPHTSGDDLDNQVQHRLRKFGNGPDKKTRIIADLRIGEYLLARRPSGLRKMSLTSDKLKSNEKPEVREDVELRKLTAIANYPRLARFFAVTIDLDIKAQEFSSEYAAIQATLDPNLPHRFQSATLCNLKNDGFRPIDFSETEFGKFDEKKDEHRDGFLNLAMRRRMGNGKRFALKALDMRATVESTLRMGQEVQTDRANRVPDEFIDMVAPELRSVGISLIDRDRRSAVIKDQAFAEFRNNIARDHPDEDKTASQKLVTDDLVDGLRFDIGFRDPSPDAIIKGKVQWRSAGGREIVYQDSVERFMPLGNDTDDHRRPWLRDLDEAVIQMPLRIMRSPEDPGGNTYKTFNEQTETSVQASSILQNYEGWSLGLPSRASVSGLAKDEMPVSIFYGHLFDHTTTPKDGKASNNIVKMKFGREFRVRVRLSYIGGGGLSWRQAHDLYEAEDKKNPSDRTIPTSEPYVFRRFERVRAPLALLFEPLDGKEPMLRVRNNKGVGLPERYKNAGAVGADSLNLTEAGENSGSQARHLVVRNFAEPDRNMTSLSKEGAGRARRVLVPEEVPVDLADMHNVFADYHKDWPPPGAFPNLRLMPKTGEFPTVDDPKGVLTDFEPGDKQGREPHQQNRSYIGRTSDQIAIPDRRREEPENPYYPDPMAQRVYVAWIPDHATNLSQVTIREAAFYKNTTRPVPQEALVHLLEVIRSTKTKFDVDKANLSDGDWEGILSKTFRLELAPAEQGTLHFWCTPDDKAYAKPGDDANMATHPNTLEVVYQTAKILEKAAKNAVKTPRIMADGPEFTITVNGQPAGELAKVLDEKPDAILEQFRNGFDGNLPPIPNLFPSITMDVVHATQKPVKAPTFIKDQGSENPSFALVHLNIPTEGKTPADDTRAAFVTYLTKHEDEIRSNWISELNGTEGFLAGTINYHPASTDKLQVWAHWLDHGKDAIKYDPNTKRYSHQPVKKFQMLCELDQLARPEEKTGQDTVNIKIEGVKGSIRIKTPDFLPGFARDLKIIPRGFSRYASYFPEIADEADKKDAEAPVGALKREDPGSFALDGAEITYCVKAAKRPSPPEVGKIKPSAGTEPRKITAEERVYEARYVQRVYLENWNEFGNEEQLAVILPPKSLVRGWNSRGKVIDDVRDAIITDPKQKHLWDVLTIWGSDATEESGKLSHLVGPEHFMNKEKVLEIELPINATDKTKKGTLKNDPNLSTVRATVALFNPEVEPTTGKFYCDIDVRSHSARAFIRFGFARYQPKGVEGAQISTPIVIDPSQVRPNRKVVVTREKEDIVVTVTGMGYIQKKADWEDLDLKVSDLNDDLSDHDADATKHDRRDRFQWPEMYVRMMKATDGLREGLQVIDSKTGKQVCTTKQQAQFKSWLPRRREPRLQWNFKVPDRGKPGDGERRYLLLVEQDVYASDPDDPSKPDRKGSRIAQRPAGMIRVELD